MQDNNPKFFILPIVYLPPYPMMFPSFEQTNNTEKMHEDMKKQFSLPYPEDDNDD